MSDERISLGIPGLDEVLHGGLLRGRTYLVTGPPGSGKTTLAWHFLVSGTDAGESALLITFGESEKALRANARLSGFDPTAVHVLDLSPSSEFFAEDQTYDIFSPAEVEREPTTRRIKDAIARIRPTRVCIDSMSHLRYLSRDPQQFRRQAVSFFRFLTDQGSTVVITSETSDGQSDDDLRFLSDSVIQLTVDGRARFIQVTKFRGSGFRPGMHAVRLDGAGVTVFPRLIPESHGRAYEPETLSSGLPHFDELLHGGIERGTVNMITGPSGVGKSTLGAQLMKEAAQRGDRSVVYTFDERAATLIERCESVKIPLRDMLGTGSLEIFEVEALRFGADEFADIVRRDVETKNTKLVMIDSVAGYRISVPGENIAERLHALCKYLQNVGVTVLLINEIRELAEFRVSDVGVSYLADNVVFMRYIERRLDGRAELGKAIGVLKKRLSDFEKTLRDFKITSNGVQIGDPLPYLSGIFGPMPGDAGFSRV